VILTGEGQTQIVQGSEVQFTMGPDGPSMKVLFGETVVLGADGKPVPVVQGDALDFALGQWKKPSQALEQVLRADRGKPMQRPVGSTGFTPVSTAATPVMQATAFQIPSGAQATVTSATQSRFELLDNSAGEIGEATKEGNAEAYRLRLDSGHAELSLPTGKKQVELLSGESDRFLLESLEATNARVWVGPRGLEVEVRMGEVRVGGLRVGAGKKLALGVKEPRLEDASAPVLTLPFARNVKVYAEGLTDVALALPGEGMRTVQVARDPEFKNIILEGKTAEAFVVTRANDHGTLFWRLLGDAESNIANAQFDQDNGRSGMGRGSPRAEVQESGLKATVIFQGAPPSLTFSFLPRDGATRYRVQVFRETDLRTPIAEKTVTATTCSFAAGQIREGSYVWYASAQTAQGVDLPGGKMNKLSVMYDNSRKTLAILKPSPRHKSRGSTIDAAGVAPLGSKLFVNGKSAPLDRKGRFALAVPASDALVFRLISVGGEEAFWVRRLGGER
jgi:hypothetical protein